MLGPNLVCRGRPDQRLFPPLSSNLRSLELLCKDEHTVDNFLLAVDHADNSAPPPNYHYPHLPNLQVFRCLTELDLHHLERILQPAAESGNLQVLELSFGVSFPGLSLGDFRPARDLAGVMSDNIHTLGLHDFNWAPSDDYPGYDEDSGDLFSLGSFDGQPFLDWLACFPKLHTVAVYPGQYGGVNKFIRKLILHPQIKVIHQDTLYGVHWDEALKLAAEHGVRLHHTACHVPGGWPIIEDRGGGSGKEGGAYRYDRACAEITTMGNAMPLPEGVFVRTH